MPLSFRFPSGVSPTERRSVGFLEGDPQLNAGVAFDGFDPGIKAILKRHMEWWIALIDDKPKKYHGFEDEDFRKGFVFKHVAEGVRLYGFRFHPMPESNPRHELIALCIFDSKFEDATVPAIKTRVNSWMNNVKAQAAIREYKYYREREEAARNKKGSR